MSRSVVWAVFYGAACIGATGVPTSVDAGTTKARVELFVGDNAAKLLQLRPAVPLMILAQDDQVIALVLGETVAEAQLARDRLIVDVKSTSMR